MKTGVYTLFAGVLAMLLSGCATYLDSPMQKIMVLTPGANNARCTLVADEANYVAYPPQAITVRRMQEPMRVTCMAPGNREKTMVIYSGINAATTNNAFNGGVGLAVDQLSGALYQYPETVVVDFRNTRATAQALPNYHNVDTVSPFDQVNEDAGPKMAQSPAEQGLVKVPRVPETEKGGRVFSKESPAPDNVPSPAPLKGIASPY